MADPVKAIAGRIRRRCAMAGLAIERSDSAAWQSLLFDGGRHHIALRLDGDHIEEAITSLHDEIGATDFAIPGHLIAEIRVTRVDRSAGRALITIDALTIRN